MKVKRHSWMQSVALFLSILIVVNSLPNVFLYHTVQAAGNPLIVLEGYADRGLDPNDPVLYGDQTMTVSGVFAPGIQGDMLRFKITSGGQTIDYSSIKPILDGNRFTFRDIALQKGLNDIVFYEKNGNLSRELLHFYVQYNDTPILSNLRVNDRDILPPGEGPTIVSVPSTSRLTVYIDGRGKNVEQVEVTNRRTEDTIRADVVGGVFSASVAVDVGENDISFRAINGNKEVFYLDRSILVTVGTGGNHLLYGVNVGALQLDPDAVTNIPVGHALSAATGRDVVVADNDATVSGRLLLNLAGYQTRKLTDIEIIARSTGGDTFTIYHNSNPEMAYTSPSQGLRLYTWTGSLGDLPFTQGERWQLYARYTYEDGSIIGTDTVQDHRYEIALVDRDTPRFVTIRDLARDKVWLDEGRYDVPYIPLVLHVETVHMLNNAGTFDTASFQLRYNGQTLVENTDYTIKDIKTDQATAKAQFTLELLKLPSGNGLLSMAFMPEGTQGIVAEQRFYLHVTLAPYVYIQYTKDAQTWLPLDQDIEIRDPSLFYGLRLKVYNYPLRLDAGGQLNNVVLMFNGTAVDATLMTVDTQAAMITLSRQPDLTDFLKNVLVQGNNTFKVVLTDAPETNYKYGIRLFSATLPTIGEVTLKVEENGRPVDLLAPADGGPFRTQALFLREMRFAIPNPPSDQATLHIEKNGRRIADYAYDAANRRWTFIPSDAFRAVTKDWPQKLVDAFVRYNFPQEIAATSAFTGGMRSRDYADLIEIIQKTYTDPAEQNALLEQFPFTLVRGGETAYTITVEDDKGRRVERRLVISRSVATWEVLAPLKGKPTDSYPIVNANQIEVRVYAEKASAVIFGKQAAKVSNTTEPDFYFDETLGRLVPQTYYVFHAYVPLKPGLNRIPFTVQIQDKTYKDELIVFNAGVPLSGAQYIDTLGKKTKFDVFDKNLTLTFPKGTTLIAPPPDRAGDEVIDPRSQIYTDVPLYFAIAERTTGQVTIPGYTLEPRLILPPNFNYASPLYYIDGGDRNAPGGRDPYESNRSMIGGALVTLTPFAARTYDNLVPSSRGVLTLHYDSAIVDQANNLLTVFFNDGSGWQNIGGVVDPKKKTITVPFNRFGYYMVMKMRESFHDVVFHPYARNSMETMYAKGYLTNYSNSVFGADRQISRGEIVTALVKALELPINAGPYSDLKGRYPLEPTFQDVRPYYDSWDHAYKYIETAARAGIIRGKTPGYYRPDDSLTRQEAATILARAMNLKLPATPEAAALLLGKTFVDSKTIDYYALQSVAAVTKAGLMQGAPVDPTAKKILYTFNPNAPLTRAEMAVILERVLIQMKKLPKP